MNELPWMELAKSLLGTKETPGAGNNPVIMEWAKVIGQAGPYSADSIPWCGLFVGFVFGQMGIQPVKDPLWALNWNKFGTYLDKTKPVYGAVAAFQRQGGGHVGLVVGHDAQALHILGGNQSDAVTITRVAKNRCKGLRWPPFGDNFPPGPVMPKTTLNATMSQNEA
jgi:uncharacterized protein (TIGR02594 family)